MKSASSVSPSGLTAWSSEDEAGAVKRLAGCPSGKPLPRRAPPGSARGRVRARAFGRRKQACAGARRCAWECGSSSPGLRSSARPPADPPVGVGRELVALPPVELVDRAVQAERALLDQVEEWEALVAVVLGDRDDQAQVRFDHRLPRARVTTFDQLRQLDFLGRGQERTATCIAQEKVERIRRRLVVRHRMSSLRTGNRSQRVEEPATSDGAGFGVRYDCSPWPEPAV